MESDQCAPSTTISYFGLTHARSRWHSNARRLQTNPNCAELKELLGIDGVKHVIFGHTHTEIDGADEQARVKNYFNTGSWVGSIDLSKRENRKRLSRLSGADLKDDSLFDLRFRTAMIEVDNLGTRVELQRLDI